MENILKKIREYPDLIRILGFTPEKAVLFYLEYSNDPRYDEFYGLTTFQFSERVRDHSDLLPLYESYRE